jgi:hypothetical protein
MVKIANRIIGESATGKVTGQDAVSNPPQGATKIASSKLTAQEFYKDKFEQVQKNKEAREEKSSWTFFGALFLGPLVGTSIGGPIADKTEDKNKKNDLRDMIEKGREQIKKLEAELAEVYDSSFVATGDWFSGRDKGAESTNVNHVTAKKQTAKDDDD